MIVEIFVIHLYTLILLFRLSGIFFFFWKKDIVLLFAVAWVMCLGADIKSKVERLDIFGFVNSLVQKKEVMIG